MFRKLSSDTFFLILIVGIILVLGLPRISMPGFWDEPKVYLKPLFALYEDFFGYFQASLTNTHRPPGVHFLYLPFLWIFGPHMEVIRLLNLVYFSAGLICFYKVFSREDKILAKITLTFAILTPIFQVYSVQYVGEPQLFFLISLYLYLLIFHLERSLLIFFAGMFLGFSRETTLALIPAAGVMLYLSGKRGKAILPILGPLFGCSLYWLFTYVKTGGIFSHLTIDAGHIDIWREPFQRLMKVRQTLLAPYRLIPLILCSVIFFIAGKSWKRPAPLTAFVVILFVSFVFVFSGHEHGIPRYFYAAFPFGVYLLLKPMKIFMSTPKKSLGMILLILLPPLLIGNPTRKIPGPFYAFQGYQDTWDHLSILRLHEEVISEVKSNWPQGSVVMTSWPFLEMLKLNHGGYGARVEYVLTMEPLSGDLPDVFLFTDFPQQLSEEDLKTVMESKRYRERIFSFKDYHLRLFEKVAPR